MKAGRSRPQRSCLGCRKVGNQEDMIRYVCSPDREILIDYRDKLPGRGAYTCIDVDCVIRAVARRQFDRAFKGGCLPQSVEGLLDGFQKALADRLLSLLGMARKSGQVLSGSNLVLDALDHPGKLAAVILAGDISEGIAEKVERKTKQTGLPCLRLSDKADLGLILGKGERSVVALSRGTLAEAFLNDWRKLQVIYSGRTSGVS